MSKSSPRPDFKAALKTLNVSGALQIPKNFVLQPPTLPRIEVPQNEVPTNGVPQIEGPRSDVPRNKDAHLEVPQIKGAQNEVLQKKVPQKAGATAGYFIMSHAVFQDPVVRTLSGDGFRVFLWMSCQAWRFRNSIGQVQAAVSWIARETGVSEAAVSRILRLLTDRGLIKRVRVDYQIGNLWEVMDLAKWRSDAGSEEANQRPQNEVPRIEVPQNQGPVPSKRGSRTIKMREPHPQNEGDIIKLSILSKKNSLSGSFADERIAEYFAKLRPAEKRKSERVHFGKLRQDYSEEEIGDALGHLQTRGMPGLGDACHSPMAFLARAMDQVLEQARGETAREAEVKAEAERKAALLAQQLEECDREAARVEKLERDFFEANPSERQQEVYFNRVLQQFPMLNSTGPAIRNLAIRAWAEECLDRAKVRR